MADPVGAALVKQIVTQLTQTGVYVAPSLADEVTGSNVSAIAGTIQAHEPAVYVIAVPLTDSASVVTLANAVHARLGHPGVFFVSWRDGRSWDLQAVKFGVDTDGRDVDAAFKAFDAHPRDLAAQLLDAATIFTSPPSTSSSAGTVASLGSDVPSRASDTISPWWLSVPVVIAALIAVVALTVRRRSRRRVAHTGRRVASGRHEPGASHAASRGSHRR